MLIADRTGQSMRKLIKAGVLVTAALTGAACFAASPAQAAAERVDELVRNALQLDFDAQRGGAIYRAHCVSCHGAQAHGDPVRDIPALAGQRLAYLIKQLADFSERERASEDMHAVVTRADISEPQEWADVAAYVNGLRPIKRPQRGDGRYLALGEKIFREHCSSCHEADARGDDEGFVPSLRNQHYTYLLNEIRTIARWHTRDFDEDLVQFFNSLDEDEMTGLADYLSRQHGPVRDRARLRDDGAVVE
jgi:cytochrome c553